jgi:hypothetical protein
LLNYYIIIARLRERVKHNFEILFLKKKSLSNGGRTAGGTRTADDRPYDGGRVGVTAEAGGKSSGESEINSREKNFLVEFHKKLLTCSPFRGTLLQTNPL